MSVPGQLHGFETLTNFTQLLTEAEQIEIIPVT